MTQSTHIRIRDFSLLAFFLVSLAFSWVNCTIPLPECTKAPCVREGFVEVQGVCVLAENKDNVAKTCQLEPITETTPESKPETTPEQAPEPVTSDAGEPHQPDTNTPETRQETKTEPSKASKAPQTNKLIHLRSRSIVRLRDIVADYNGNTFVTGDLMLDISDGQNTIKLQRLPVFFVAKFGKESQWDWLIYSQGENYSSGVSIVPGPAFEKKEEETVFVLGEYSKQFWVGSYKHTVPTASGSAAFVARINVQTGAIASFATSSHTISIEPRALDVDQNGNAHATGVFSGNPTFGKHSLSSQHSGIFVAKLGYDTNTWEWASQTKNEAFAKPNAIKANISSIWITGSFQNSIWFGATKQLRGSQGKENLFVASLGTSGNWFNAQAAIFSNGSSEGKTIHVVTQHAHDSFIYVAGEFTDVLELQKGDQMSAKGGRDIFIAKLAGGHPNNWLWSVSAGSNRDDYVHAMQQLPNQNLVLAGTYGGPLKLGTTPTLTPINQVGPSSLFLAEASTQIPGEWKWSKRAGSSGVNTLANIFFSPPSTLTIAGTFTLKATFDDKSLTSFGDADGFIWKLSFGE